MSKFVAISDDGGVSESASSCCGDGQSDPLLCSRSRSGSDLLDITCTSEESFSFSLPDISSVCDDGEQALTRHNTSVSTDAGSTAYQSFLLCFDQERELQELQKRALLNVSSSSSSAAQLQLQRQLQTQAQQQRHRESNGAICNNSAVLCKVVPSPRFLWQSPPEGSVLCCHPETTTLKAHDDDIFLFEESELLDGDEDGGEDKNDLDDSETLLLPSYERDSFGSSIMDTHNTGGTVDDPRYVPRPSSTTPSLREMSKFFRASNSSDDEDLSHNQVMEQRENRASAFETPAQCKIQQPIEKPSPYYTFNNDSSKRLETINASSKGLLDKKTPPLRNRLLHRRTRSEEKRIQCSASSFSVVSPSSSSSVVTTSTEPLPLPRSRTADALTSARSLGPSFSTTTSDGDHKKVKNPMMKMLRRTRLPSFRKHHKGRDKSMLRPESPKVTGTPNNSEIGGENSNAAADVANILASLEISLRTRTEEIGNRRQVGLPRSPNSVFSTETKPIAGRQPSQAKQEFPSLQLPSLQQSGDAQSDSSSLDDVFSGVISDDMDDENDAETRCSSASSQDSRSTVDRFLSSPYSRNEQSPHFWSSETKASTECHIRYPYHYEEGGRVESSWGMNPTSMLSSPAEFARCSSVDTAKASNLGGIGADRARLLELQAFLFQQQQQERNRLSSPPLDFETPNGDGVIRVQEAVCETIDAACEIEVLPKIDFFRGAPSTSPAGEVLPSTAAEF